jgi:putative heme iron utilization protein
MNEDHAEAVVLYAQAFGERPQTERAEMIAVDPQGMNLRIQVNGITETIRIPFNHVLEDSEDAHQTLIAMVRQARNPA